MITLYLDNQLYIYLKNKDDNRYFKGEAGAKRKQDIHKLEDYLQSNRDDFLIFYSQAHLLDLAEDTSNDEERQVADLNYRGLWADDNYLAFDEKDKRTNYKLTRPLEAFEPFFNRTDKYDLDFGKLLDFSDYEEWMDEEELNELRERKKLIEGFTFPSWDDLPGMENLSDEERERLKRIFPVFNGGSMVDAMNRMMKFMRDFESDNSIYKDLRNSVLSGVEKAKQISTDTVFPKDSFFIDLAKLDISSSDKIGFVRDKLLGIVRRNLEATGKKEPTQFDLHYHAYFTLDLMGIEKEKKPATANMLHDGHHSFYGGYCEVVVSDDEKFRAKSKLIYQLFGLSTNVYSVEEFLGQSYSIELEKINDIESLFDRLVHDLKHGLITESGPKSMLTTVREIKPMMRYFEYFNQVLNVHENGQSGTIFRHNGNTYMKGLPLKIVRAVCDKAYKMFGIDDLGYSLYKTEEENQEIIDGRWRGRAWHVGRLTFALQYRSESQLIQLVISVD